MYKQSQNRSTTESLPDSLVSFCRGVWHFWVSSSLYFSAFVATLISDKPTCTICRYYVERPSFSKRRSNRSGTPHIHGLSLQRAPKRPTCLVRSADRGLHQSFHQSFHECSAFTVNMRRRGVEGTLAKHLSSVGMVGSWYLLVRQGCICRRRRRTLPFLWRRETFLAVAWPRGRRTLFLSAVSRFSHVVGPRCWR